MSFLNWILLGGIAAFAAPLIIHLLNRTPFKVVDWGAMHLLEAAMQVNSQRIQWQSLLLLLLRCLIPILLAIGLARPVLTNWRSANGGGDKSLVILIDNSISMQAIIASDGLRFQQAISQAQAIVKRQPPSTEVSLWTIGGHPIDVLNGTTFDHARVTNKLESLACGAGSIPVQPSIAAALKQVNTMQNATREVIVISDFQANEWSLLSAAERETIKQQLAVERLPVQLTFLPIREPIEKKNLSIAIQPMEQPLIVANQAFRITATVRNHSAQPSENVPVVLEVSGTEIASRRLTVPANGMSQAVFDCQIESPGTHVVKLRIEDAQGLATDNTSDHVVEVRAPLRVLLVDKQANAPELQRASGYLSLSLSPFRSGDVGKNCVVTRVIRPDQLSKAEIEDHEVLVIGDAPRLGDQIENDIAEFVRMGGGLMLFSCNEIDQNWYNARWGSDSKTPLLPANYSSNAKLTVSKLRVSSELATHPALGFFKQTGGEDFSSIEVKNIHGLNINSKSELSEAAQVLLKLESGEPLLIAKSFGSGSVLQFANSADTSGSNLPLRPIYVPLMQSLVQWLAVGVDDVRNAITGQPIVVKSQWSRETGKGTETTERTAIITLPDQSIVEQKYDLKQPLVFTKTAFPGIYAFDLTKGSLAKNEHSNDTSVTQQENIEHFAVNAATEESQLEFLSREELNELATSTGASVATDAQELLSMQNLRANGREAWRWFLLGLVALLFIELWWQQRITRGPL